MSCTFLTVEHCEALLPHLWLCVLVAGCMRRALCRRTIENNKNGRQRKMLENTLQRNGNGYGYAYATNTVCLEKRISLFPSSWVHFGAYIFFCVSILVFSRLTSANWSVCIFGGVLRKPRAKNSLICIMHSLLSHLIVRLSTENWCDDSGARDDKDRNRHKIREMVKFMVASNSPFVPIAKSEICIKIEMKMVNGRTCNHITLALAWLGWLLAVNFAEVGNYYSLDFVCKWYSRHPPPDVVIHAMRTHAMTSVLRQRTHTFTPSSKAMWCRSESLTHSQPK